MRKILGQLAGTGALAPLYTVPAGQQAVVSSCVLSNTGAAAVAVRVTAAKAGANDSPAHTLVLITLQGGQRLSLVEGWTLAATDVIRLNAPAAVSALLFGSEVSAA